MHRREAIKNVAFLLGGALSATTIAAVIDGCTSPVSKTSKLFTADQEKMIAEIAEIIFPSTKLSPGAKEAGVAAFIPMMLQDCYPEEAQKEFTKGLEDLNKRAQDSFKADFLSITPEQRLTIISAVREKTIADMADEKKIKEDLKKEQEQLKKTQEKERPGAPKAIVEEPKNKAYFFAMARDLTILGFFTSEVGATKAYEYVEIPGRYNGCVDMKPGQRVLV